MEVLEVLFYELSLGIIRLSLIGTRAFLRVWLAEAFDYRVPLTQKDLLHEMTSFAAPPPTENLGFACRNTE